MIDKITLSVDTKEKLDSYIKIKSEVESRVKNVENWLGNNVESMSTCWSPLGLIEAEVNYKNETSILHKGITVLDYMYNLESYEKIEI